MGMGATPFMLALLLQVAFGLSALQAGLMTFASAAAALVSEDLRPAHSRPLRIQANPERKCRDRCGNVHGLMRSSRHWHPALGDLLFIAGGGFFRSLQFTSLNGMAFADIDHAQMSRASTMSTMGQQLAQSMGIGMAAMFLRLSMIHSHATHLTADTIGPAFIAVGVVALISVLFFLPLPKNAGEGLHGVARRGRLARA